MSTRREERRAADTKRNIIVAVIVLLITNIVVIMCIVVLGMIGILDIKDGKITVHNNNVGIEDKMDTFVMPTSNSLAVRADAAINHFITDDMSDYQKVKAIHDFLVDWTTYDYDEYANRGSNPSAHKESGVFIKGRAVCDGYSSSFKLLCDLAGIECDIITGKASDIFNNDKHAWNIVKIDSNWYQVDVTWDDNITEQTGSETILYDYFLVTDKIMSLSHTWEDTGYERCMNEDYLYKAYKDAGQLARNDIKLRDVFDKQYNEGCKTITILYDKQGLPSLDFIAEKYGEYSWYYGFIGDACRITVIID
jgi:hypothetical protein